MFCNVQAEAKGSWDFGVIYIYRCGSFKSRRQTARPGPPVGALYEISQHDWLVWCPADRKYAHVTVWDDQWGLEVGL